VGDGKAGPSGVSSANWTLACGRRLARFPSPSRWGAIGTKFSLAGSQSVIVASFVEVVKKKSTSNVLHGRFDGADPTIRDGGTVSLGNEFGPWTRRCRCAEIVGPMGVGKSGPKPKQGRNEDEGCFSAGNPNRSQKGLQRVTDPAKAGKKLNRQTPAKGDGEGQSHSESSAAGHDAALFQQRGRIHFFVCFVFAVENKKNVFSARCSTRKKNWRTGPKISFGRGRGGTQGVGPAGFKAEGGTPPGTFAAIPTGQRGPGLTVIAMRLKRLLLLRMEPRAHLRG